VADLEKLAVASLLLAEDVASDEAYGSRPALYSYADVVALRTFARMRERMPLQKVRKSVAYVLGQLPEGRTSRPRRSARSQEASRRSGSKTMTTSIPLSSLVRLASRRSSRVSSGGSQYSEVGRFLIWSALLPDS
jgi:hypothetical protein